MTEADIVARVSLLETSQGGRVGPTPSSYFGCLALLRTGEYRDCRLLLASVGSLSPGQAADVPIKFLDPEVMTRLRPGDSFVLWESRAIGQAEVLAISK
jgi:hypothetical protein